MSEPPESWETGDQQAYQPGPTETADDAEHPTFWTRVVLHEGEHLEHIRKIQLVMSLLALTLSVYLLLAGPASCPHSLRSKLLLGDFSHLQSGLLGKLRLHHLSIKCSAVMSPTLHSLLSSSL